MVNARHLQLGRTLGNPCSHRPHSCTHRLDVFCILDQSGSRTGRRWVLWPVLTAPIQPKKPGGKVCWGFAYCTDQSVRTQKRSISVTLCIGERERERGPVPGMPTPLNIQNRQQRSLHEIPMMGQEMNVTTAAIVVGACSLMCKTEGPFCVAPITCFYPFRHGFRQRFDGHAEELHHRNSHHGCKPHHRNKIQKMRASCVRDGGGT